MQPLLACKAFSVRIQFAVFASCSSVHHVDDEVSTLWSSSCWKNAPCINFRGGVCHFLFCETRVVAKEKRSEAESRSLRSGACSSPGLVRMLIFVCLRIVPGTCPGLVRWFVVVYWCDVRDSLIRPENVVGGCILLAFARFLRAWPCFVRVL